MIHLPTNEEKPLISNVHKAATRLQNDELCSESAKGQSVDTTGFKGFSHSEGGHGGSSNQQSAGNCGHQPGKGHAGRGEQHGWGSKQHYDSSYWGAGNRQLQKPAPGRANNETWRRQATITQPDPCPSFSTPALKGAQNNDKSETQKSKAAISDTNKLYPPNVGICIVNSQGLVFSAKRIKNHADDSWHMPQGGIDEGEDPEAAAIRKLEEKTSIRNARIVGELDKWLPYDYTAEDMQCFSKSWQVYKGQKQKWFLVHFYGDDSEINIFTRKRAFKQWRWINIQDLPQSAVPFKKDVYQQVTQEFAPMIEKLKETGEFSVKDKALTA
ncbi:hypothetical protein CEUSTIGMA_g1617.t1 [Chlamydomonas eustigma]|uniref:Nudix hydrolase domain-containing protein n=1 Tax=Chlamydomonas eustigma TaxID=1157962 RepID=A0A250WTL4_9CHLO|nr:hypothetical protein CEUSTIGMA_g1617.t1 [Chlamydomonas eustigma]|eukprot:GAX74168.1 hypothetical protein CEUSTIGMA_g1617.t1 [Chlamydomonas eustigma]